MATIKELIEQAGGTAKESVETAKTRYLDQVRGILRDLTRLKFSERQGAEAQHTSVPMRVVPGLPEPLKSMAEEQLPSGERWGIETIGLWAQDIKSLQGVAERLKPLIARLGQVPEWTDRANDYGHKLHGATMLADKLAEYAAKAELLRRITQINQDILGVYMPTARLIPDKGQIELYWVLIGAVARLLGVDTEALAVVVMTHELAHAYTHLGLDSSKNRWEDGFWGCDPGIVEGLAQYYTHLTAAALKKERGYDRVWTAYEQFTNLQKANGAEVYVNHLSWMETISPEAIRQALLDLRGGLIASNFQEFHDAIRHLAKRYPLKRNRPSLGLS
ncbi:MAG: hypothetical protein ACLPLR_01935 [Terriglobales bacterium]